MGVILLLSSCASPRIEKNQNLINDKDAATIIIKRSDDILFLGVPARVKINGEEVADLWRSETYDGKFPPGKTVISVDAWSTPGEFVMDMDTTPNKTYRLTIYPRGDHYTVLTLFGPLGALVNANLQKNTGPFAVGIEKMD